MRNFIVVALLSLIASATGAQAHAHLDHATPPAGGTVASAPHDVTLSFTENLEPAFSTIAVTDTSGARVDQGKADVNGNTMGIGLQSLPAGIYTVHWHAVSVDTHTTEGTFTFHVSGPAR